MEVGFTVHLNGAVPGSAQLSQANFNRVKKHTWIKRGHQWHDQFRDIHFTKQGAAKYGYRKRVGEESGARGKKFWQSYTGEKLRRFGHTDPLVYTGQTRRRARQRKITATATKTKSKLRITLNTPVLKFRPKGWPYSLRAEMVQVAPDEVKAIAKEQGQDMVRIMRGISGTTSRKIR